MIINFFDEAKAYTALLLQQFSNLQLKINDSSLYTIPILFATPDRLHAKLTTNGQTSQSIKYRKPIMSLMLKNDEVDLTRVTNRLLKRKKVKTSDTTFNITYNDQPTNFNFQLWIKADTFTSLTNIISAITTTFYNNVLYLDYKSPIGETISTPVLLKGVEYMVDNNEDNNNMDRTIDASIDFTIQGVRHSQFTTETGFIKEIEFFLNIFVKDIENTLEQYLIEPK